jgi:hypothetical protein
MVLYTLRAVVVHLVVTVKRDFLSMDWAHVVGWSRRGSWAFSSLPTFFDQINQLVILRYLA